MEDDELRELAMNSAMDMEIAVHRGFLIFDETMRAVRWKWRRIERAEAIYAVFLSCSFSLGVVSSSKWISFSRQ